MKVNNNLILIGMMASGKSTVGRLLAKKLNLRFYDTDFIIERKTKMKISEIFEKRGENEFRNLEKKIALRLLDKNNYVISLGGGAFLNHSIKKKAQKNGDTICLNWNTKTIISRIRKNNKRPIALNLTNNEIKDLIIKRSKIYAEAKYKINCENMTKLEIINTIIKMLKL